MTFFTQSQYDKLIRNGEKKDQDHVPVVKLTIKGAGCTWLLTELDPYDPLCAFGLCDLGLGYPELGYVDLRELAGLKLPGSLKVEADPDFAGRHAISVYANAARECSAITEDEAVLQRAYFPARRLGYSPG